MKKVQKGLKSFLKKDLKMSLMKIKKNILLNAMMLFDIRNAIVSLLWNGFIRSYQSTIELAQSVGERTKLRRQRL